MKTIMSISLLALVMLFGTQTASAACGPELTLQQLADQHAHVFIGTISEVNATSFEESEQYYFEFDRQRVEVSFDIDTSYRGAQDSVTTYTDTNPFNCGFDSAEDLENDSMWLVFANEDARMHPQTVAVDSIQEASDMMKAVQLSTVAVSPNKPVVCMKDIKVCPDGTEIMRTLPACLHRVCSDAEMVTPEVAGAFTDVHAMEDSESEEKVGFGTRIKRFFKKLFGGSDDHDKDYNDHVDTESMTQEEKDELKAELEEELAELQAELKMQQSAAGVLSAE